MTVNRPPFSPAPSDANCTSTIRPSREPAGHGPGLERGAREVHPPDELSEGLGRRDAEVVADEQPDLRPRGNRTEKPLADMVEAGGLDERCEQVDLTRAREPVCELGPEGAIGAGGEREPGRSCRPRKIIPLFRNHMPHTAAGIRHVAGIPRDHVHMHMRHGLAGGRSAIETHVVAIGLRLEPRVKHRFHDADHRHQAVFLVVCAIKKGGHHPMRDHQHMARRHGKPVVDREAVLIYTDPLVPGEIQEWRGGR